MSLDHILLYRVVDIEHVCRNRQHGWPYKKGMVDLQIVALMIFADRSEKVTTNAILLIGYCLGNFIGPFFFLDSQAPTYTLGVGMMFFCVGVQVLSILGIMLVLWRRNNARKQYWAENSPTGHDLGLMDMTDRGNKYFKYVY